MQSEEWGARLVEGRNDLMGWLVERGGRDERNLVVQPSHSRRAVLLRASCHISWGKIQASRA